jgi:hypothetical protein
MISDHISLPVFLVSFALGLFFIYVIGPEEKPIYVYPTPTNYNSVLYKDKTDECFQFKPVNTMCPLNPFTIKTVPLQT